MLKKVLFAVVATGFVAALALPVQSKAAEAATTCKDAAKMEFPNDRKARRAFKKDCKAAWKASQG
jgi:Na+-translocating ferredoxin:NAD+ oxidoreductase RnfG subunit